MSIIGIVLVVVGVVFFLAVFAWVFYHDPEGILKSIF